MKNQEKTKEKNYYKIAFFVTLSLIAFFIVCYGITLSLGAYYERGVQEGQSSTLNSLVQSVAQMGYITFSSEEFNLTLVPEQSIILAQEQVVLSIMNEIRTQGYVVLFDNQTQMVLVQISKEQLQESLSQSQ